MSLMLRKTCEECLYKAGLESFHVQINTDNKYLEIVTECGKPFVSVSGITFARLTPTIAEIDYAEELLTAFIIKHKIAIDRVILKSKKINNQIDLVDVYPKFSFEVNGHYSKVPRSVSYKDDIFFVRVHRDNKIKISICNEDKTSDKLMSDIELFTFNKNLHLQAIELLAKWVKQYKEEQELDVLKNELATCEI